VRAILIPPVFTSYVDESPYSTIHLCQQVGEYLKGIGWQVTLYALHGSISKRFEIVQFEGDPQPSIIDPRQTYTTGSVLIDIVSSTMDALVSGEYDVAVNFGHDVLPYSTDFERFLNVVTFSAGIVPVIDASIDTALKLNAHRLGFISKSQAAAYGAKMVIPPLYCPVTPSGRAVCSPQGGVLFAGRVTRSKGIDNAVALCRSAGVTLTVAGQYDNLDGLDDLLSESHVRYVGCLSRDKLYDLMRESTALLQLQNCDLDEAFGMVTAEALCAGLPVITWECGANTELVQEGDGIVVMPGDMAAAAEAICDIGSWTIKQREQIRQRATDRFLLASVGKRYEEWIKTAIR